MTPFVQLIYRNYGTLPATGKRRLPDPFSAASFLQSFSKNCPAGFNYPLLVVTLFKVKGEVFLSAVSDD